MRDVVECSRGGIEVTSSRGGKSEKLDLRDLLQYIKGEVVTADQYVEID